MKSIILLSILTIAISCTNGIDKVKSNNNKETVLEKDKILIQLGNKKIALSGLTKNNFGIDKKGDTIFILKKGYEGVDTMGIEFVDADNKDSILAGEIIYGINQYLLDDMGETLPLKFSFKEHIQIHKNKGKFEISPIIKNEKQLQDIYQNDYFDEIRKESYQAQKKFYQNEVINKQKNYNYCCPEYIEKAKQFLLKKENDFNSLIDLSLEPDYKKIILNISNNKYLVFYNKTK